MNRKIRDFAQVLNGYAFRGAIHSDPSGTVKTFQAKDLVQNVPVIDTQSLTNVIKPNTKGEAYLRKNDVLVVAKGLRAGAFRSTVYLADETNVLATASVHIVRIESSDIIAQYVSQYLNSHVAQEYLADQVTGTYIGSLPRRALEEFKIPIPPLARQKILVNLHLNFDSQIKLFEKRASALKALTHNIYKELNAI